MNVDIENIKNVLNEGELIIFVGAGISAHTSDNEPIATWKGLLKSGLKKCVELERLGSKAFESYCKKLESKDANADYYLHVSNIMLEHFENELDENQNFVLKSWLKDTIGTLTPKNLDLVSAIGKLNCPIFTTNYDSLLEVALNRKALTWSKYKSEGIGNKFTNLKNYVVHVHGYYEEPESVVLNADGYDQVRKDDFAQSILKAVLLTKNILFIGFGSGLSDPNFSNLLEWKNSIANNNYQLPIYKLVRTEKAYEASFDNIKTIVYGSNNQDLLNFLNNLEPVQSQTEIQTSPIKIEKDTSEKRNYILKKYLKFLIEEYGNISIFGYSKAELKLELQKVFVHLKFDKTHPSIKAMKSLAIENEFNRRVLDPNFLNNVEKIKILNAYAKLCGKGMQNVNNLYKNLLIEPWLNNLLSNKKIFNDEERDAIKTKIANVKKNVIEDLDMNLSDNYTIKDAYSQFKHMVILGNPGSGKTTLSKWLILNMAKQGLEMENALFDSDYKFSYKLPIIIPIWKYIESLNSAESKQKQSLLKFIYNDPTCGSRFFENSEDKQILSEIVIESLMKQNTLIILEGLDEIPVYMNRNELMKEINSLLERAIEYDAKSKNLSYSIFEQKEICNTADVDFGNRFIITCRIEGNYFQEINYYTPRLTIEDMTDQALEAFCLSYMSCINETTKKIGLTNKIYEPGQLYSDIIKSEDILKLAINPQLTSVIASIYNQCDGVLPDKRIDLYEKAIEKMIERLVEMISSEQTKPNSNKSFSLNKVVILTIMQEIAEYLHARSEGLSEESLKSLIKNSICQYEKISDKKCDDIEELTLTIVNLLKIHSGLLTEFGHNSFKFLHRTFQEYLVAMNMIYYYGNQRDENTILNNISIKIPIPNWRVPLNMAFGILSKSTKSTDAFNNILKKLVETEFNLPTTKFSSLITPYVIVDSINEMYFSSKDKEYELVDIILEKLLTDFMNKSGFSRIKEHQNLTMSYFSKLKDHYEAYLADWFFEKIKNNEFLAPCAKILLELKLNDARFYEIFLKNLHNDSREHNWPIDSALRVYKDSAKEEFKSKLKLKQFLSTSNYKKEQSSILGLLLALYGGFTNENFVQTVIELNELASFLNLPDVQRKPFTYYYQEVWGKDDPAYAMAVQADKDEAYLKKMKHESFDIKNIYKESQVTRQIIEYLKNPSLTSLKNNLEKRFNSENLELNEKIDLLIALLALGEINFVSESLKRIEEKILKNFKHRIEQIIFLLKDSVARTSISYYDDYFFEDYLIKSYEKLIKKKEEKNIDFMLYCKIHISIIKSVGTTPIDTNKLFNKIEETLENDPTLNRETFLSTSIKNYFLSEYFAYNFSSSSKDDSIKDKIQGLIKLISENYECNLELFINSILNLSNCKQFYLPLRAYLWPIDQFIFKNTHPGDIPISFINYIENISNQFSYFIKYFIFEKLNYSSEQKFKNNELKLIFVLFIFGDMSEGSKDLRFEVFESFIPEVYEKKKNEENILKYILRKIRSEFKSPYMKSRALYMLARYYDAKAHKLILDSFECAKEIDEPSLKFQVLEELMLTVYLKLGSDLEKEKNELLKNISSDLKKSASEIKDAYNKVIAEVRLGFHKKGKKRYKCFKYALDSLKQIENEQDKVELIEKLRPVVSLYKDLQKELDSIIDNLANKAEKNYLRSNFGQILFENKFDLDETEETDTDFTKIKETNELFTLFGLLNDVNQLIPNSSSKKVDQIWSDFLNEPENKATIETLIQIGMNDGLILTPQAAIVIDELINNGNSDVFLFFPYLVSPSNEVYPIIYRWFDNQQENNVKNLAALLLTESKWIFGEAIEALIKLLKSENDQLRYRAQNVFQHPDRDPKTPEKRISVIGENTLLKLILASITNEHITRVNFYLRAFFWNVEWDCPNVFESFYHKVNQIKTTEADIESCVFFNRIKFIDAKTWMKLIEIARSSNDLIFLEELFLAVMRLAHGEIISVDDWSSFSKVLLEKDFKNFKEQFYIKINVINTLNFMIEQAQNFLNKPQSDSLKINEFIEKAMQEQKTTTVNEILKGSLENLYSIGKFNFTLDANLNESILNLIKDVTITIKFFEGVLDWLMIRMSSFNGVNDTMYSLLVTSNILLLAAGLTQKDDFIYRKVTNSKEFNKSKYIKLLEKMLNNHPYYDARGSAFILLAALDSPDIQVVVDALNVLLDEIGVKEYSMIGLPMIRLSPNDFTDHVLKSLKSESAVKVFELLKIITVFAMNDKIDANTKAKILNYILRENNELSSKKPVSFSYTNLKIPFTTTLEKEFYKAWLQIQGLSGKIELLEKD